MARPNPWLRTRRWRAFLRVAGVWPWALLAALLASAALLLEVQQARRERALEAPEATDLPGAMTAESYQDSRAAGFAWAGVWLPRLLWAGVAAAGLTGVGVLTGALFSGHRYAGATVQRHRPSASGDAPRTKSKPRLEPVAPEKPRRPRPSREAELPAKRPPPPETLPFDTNGAAQPEPVAAPPPPAKKKPAPPPRRDVTPEDEERFEGMY